MHSNRIAFAAVCVLFTTQGATIDLAHSATEVGEASSITTNVEGDLDGTLATIAEGDRVFQDQVVTTDATGVAQIEFLDGTRLAIGPGSILTLDSFVYASDASATKVAIGLARGSFRFITGNSGSDAYQITTPAATIGVRGTAFDLHATESGELAIAMIDGEVIVCPANGLCRDHGLIGRFLHMTERGIFDLRDHWDGSFLTGLTFAQAFPFLSDQDILQGTMRGRADIVGRYAVRSGEALLDTGAAAATVIEDAVKVFTKPRAPKIRLPKLFK